MEYNNFPFLFLHLTFPTRKSFSYSACHCMQRPHFNLQPNIKHKQITHRVQWSKTWDLWSQLYFTFPFAQKCISQNTLRCPWNVRSPGRDAKLKKQVWTNMDQTSHFDQQTDEAKQERKKRKRKKPTFKHFSSSSKFSSYYKYLVFKISSNFFFPPRKLFLNKWW